MLSLREYKRAYERAFDARECVVYAPAVSLVSDLYLTQNVIPSNAFRIGVNHHTQILLPELIVALDKRTRKMLESYRGLVCSKCDDADLFIGECPSFGMSGCAAVWLADYLGFRKIHLLGFGLYPEGRHYWYQDEEIMKSRLNMSLEQSLMIWGLCKKSLKNPERIKVYSGELKKVFDGNFKTTENKQ